MICTSSHKNINSNLYITYAISGNRGKDEGYTGKCFPLLAPKKSFWQIWHDNIGVVSEEENNRYYVEEYYKQVLSKLDPEEVYEKLNYSVLLCYEDNNEFCHRHIVAEWFELLLDVKVPEIKKKGKIIEEVERPKYIKTYLIDVMKKELDMKGFNSLRALYLFEKGEKLEQKANELEIQTGNCYDNYRQAASYLRSDADEVEAEYNKNKFIKIKNKSRIE